MSRSPKESDRSRERRKSRRRRRHPDIEIARLLVKKGFITKDEAILALKEQKARAEQKKERRPFVQLLVKKRVLSVARLKNVQDEIRRHTYICDTCELRVVLLPSSNQSDASCPRCGHSISLEGPSEAPEPPEAFRDARGEASFPGPPGLERFETSGRAFGRYEILEEIGRGAMGVVYRAKHAALGKEVALKVLLAGEDARDAQIARFRREAAAVQKLRHPGIVAIHDFGAEADVYYLTMDLVPGGLTIHKQWKDPERAPPLRVRLEQVARVAEAIDHANQRGVIHRDLKPANVLIDRDGKVLVADFGLAKDTEDEEALTLSQDRLGTPLFMAPEQVRRGSASVDFRADVWALGVMTFVAATGRYPFRGRTIMSLYMKILHEEPDWDGTTSSSPDREGFGKALPPREIQAMEADDQQETEVASYKKAKGAPESPAGRKGESVTATPEPPTFVPPPDLQGPVPRDLRLIIEMALAKDPDRRYASAADLARDLERYCRGEAVRARPPGGFERFLRKAKRRRASIALVGLMLAGGAAAGLYVRAKRAEEEQREIARKKREAEELAAREAAERKKAERADEAVKRSDKLWPLGSAKIEQWRAVARDLGAVCAEFPEQAVPFLKRGLAHAYALEREAAAKDFDVAKKNRANAGVLTTKLALSGVLLARLRGDLDEAIAIADEALRQAPDDKELRLALGRVALAQGRPTEAERALEPLLKAGTDPEALALGAFVALERKDVALASERARAAAAIAPESAEVLAALGRTAFARGELDEAATKLKRARETFGRMGPGDAIYFLDLAKDRIVDKESRDVEGSLEGNLLSARLAPWSPSPRYWRALALYTNKGAPSAAAAELDIALQVDPLFDDAAAFRADLLFARRDAEGRARLEAAFRGEVEACGRDRARCDLAVVLIGKGELAEARTQLQAVRSSEYSGRAELLLAEVERRSGSVGGAAIETILDARRADANRAWEARRDLIALGRARLLANDGKGAVEAVRDAPFKGDDPRFDRLFFRPLNSRLILRAVRGLGHALQSRRENALKELQGAGFQGRGGWQFAPEVLPEGLETAPELSSLRGTPGFEELQGRVKGAITTD